MKRILMALLILSFFSCNDADNAIFDGAVSIGTHVRIGKIHYILFKNCVVNYTQDSIDYEEYIKYESDSRSGVMDHNPMDYILVQKALHDRDAREVDIKWRDISYPSQE
jgi:hypothetical protein